MSLKVTPLSRVPPRGSSRTSRRRCARGGVAESPAPRATNRRRGGRERKRTTHSSFLKSAATILERWVQPPPPRRRGHLHCEALLPTGREEAAGRGLRGSTYNSGAPLALNSRHLAAGVPRPTADRPNSSPSATLAAALFGLAYSSPQTKGFSTTAASQDVNQAERVAWRQVSNSPNFLGQQETTRLHTEATRFGVGDDLEGRGPQPSGSWGGADRPPPPPARLRPSSPARRQAPPLRPAVSPATSAQGPRPGRRKKAWPARATGPAPRQWPAAPAPGAPDLALALCHTTLSACA